MIEQSGIAHNIEVSIVIPTYNRKQDLIVTLAYLRQQSTQNFEVLVIDNSSSDNTADMIAEEAEKWGERLKYFVKAPNGPASARNLGIKHSQSEWVVFLDSDVGLHSEWIEKALSFMHANPKAGALGGVVVYDFDHERVNAFGGDIGVFGLAWDECEDSLLVDIKSAKRRIWANCSAMIARRSSLLDIAGFDERFFYGYEDSDLGWRINISGEEVWVAKDLIAYHRVQPEPGYSNAVIVRHYCKNRLCSLLQNTSLAGLFIRLPLYLAYTFVDLVFRGPRGAKLSGLWWNVTNIKETLVRRKIIQSKRNQSDSVILNLGSKRMLPPKPLDGHRRRPVKHDGDVNVVANNKIDDRV